jgi:hypothetical protein
LYELSQSIAEGCRYYSDSEYSKAFMMQKSKLYKAVGWDTNQKNILVKQSLWNGFVFITYLHLFQSLQHVTVAGECQTCHGPVRIWNSKQFAHLGGVLMSQKTEVKMEGNEYYTKIHDELSKIWCRQVDCSTNGRLECGKCHY